MGGLAQAAHEHNPTVRVYMVGERDAFYRILKENASNREPRIEFIGFSRTNVPKFYRSPDVLLIDANTEVTALRLLSEVERQHLDAIILLISPHDEEAWITRMLDMGVNYCLLHPVDPATLLRRILQLAAPNAKMRQHLRQEHQRGFRERKIVSLLDDIGVPGHYNGFAYLRTAISLAIEDENILNQMTGDLYPLVAKLHQVSPAHVERSMRHAIEVTWIRGNMQRINALFAYSIDQDRGKPTNSHFIARLADHFRLTFR